MSRRHRRPERARALARADRSSAASENLADRTSAEPRVVPEADRRAVVRAAPSVERLAYTRAQAAAALGISPATFARRVLPLIETIEMPWGARLVPVDELERLVAERRRAARRRLQAAAVGRRRVLSAEVVRRIGAEHASGKSLGQIARDLNAEGVPTAHGGAQWWPSTIRAVMRRAV